MNTEKIIAYGTLKRGFHNHHYCRNAVEIRDCTIIGALFDTGWGFPAFRPDLGRDRIHAEIIEVPAADIPSIDCLEGVPHLYERQMIECELADGTTEEATVYVMKKLPPRAQRLTSREKVVWLTTR